MTEPGGEAAPQRATEPARHRLSELDADFIRVLEDLVEALLANGTLRVTDLPQQALAKLDQRRKARARLRNSLDLIGDDDALL